MSNYFLRNTINNPYFVDVLGTDYPKSLTYTGSIHEGGHYITASITLPNAAMTRIGLPKSSTKAFVSARSYEAVGAGGKRIGGAVIYENGEPLDQIDLSYFDANRAGKNIVFFKDFANVPLIKPIIRISPESFFEEETGEKVNNYASFNNYGFGKEYLTVDKFGKFIPFQDFSKLVPKDLLGTTWTAGYPFVHSFKEDYMQFLDPSGCGINGAIDVFDVRKSIANTSFNDISIKGCFGSLQGGGIEGSKKGSVVIDNKWEYNNATTSDELFFDAQETVFDEFNFPLRYISGSSSSYKFSLPGYIDDHKYVASPFNDGRDHLENTIGQNVYNFLIPAYKEVYVQNRSALYNNTTIYDLTASPWESKPYTTDLNAQGNVYNSKSSLIAWWRLNQDISSTGNISDSSSNSHTLFPADTAGRPAFDITGSTVSVKPTPSNLVTADVTGSCLFYGGATTFLSASDHSDFTFSNGSVDSPFSISCWVATSALAVQGSTKHQMIVAKTNAQNETSSNLEEWHLSLVNIRANDDDYKAIQFQTYDITANKKQVINTVTGIGAAQTDNHYALNTWHHIAATYNGVKGTNGDITTSGMKIYIDGVLLPIGSYVLTSGYTAMQNTSQPVTIGNRGNRSSGIGFEGNIAEVAIWNSELSDETVKAIYNAGKNGFRNNYGKTITSLITSSRNSISEIGTRFKSATCGLVYGESNKFGTDSIAFGGLKK